MKFLCVCVCVCVACVCAKTENEWGTVEFYLPPSLHRQDHNCKNEFQLLNSIALFLIIGKQSLSSSGICNICDSSGKPTD